MPATGPWTPDADRLYRAWVGYAERWAYRRECLYPGVDLWPAASGALAKAAARFDPARNVSFRTWLDANLLRAARAPIRSDRRLRARLRSLRLGEGKDDPTGIVPGVWHDGFAWVDAEGRFEEPPDPARRPSSSGPIAWRDVPGFPGYQAALGPDGSLLVRSLRRDPPATLGPRYHHGSTIYRMLGPDGRPQNRTARSIERLTFGREKDAP